MPDRSSSPEPRRPDYFDRLLARHIPVAPPATAPSAPRVRPRLPGPFERIEALRAEPAGPDEPLPLLPPAAPRPVVRETAPRAEPEVRIERQTVIRAEPARDTGRAAPPRPAALPRSRRAAPWNPEHDQSFTVRPGRTGPATGHSADAAQAAGRGRPGEQAASSGPAKARTERLTAPEFALPRPSDRAAARQGQAQRASAGRRAARPAEPDVHIQIGRLEVRASGAARAGDGGGAAGRHGRSGRHVPSMSLDDYLTDRSRRPYGTTTRDTGR